jgi:hypothetical protein
MDFRHRVSLPAFAPQPSRYPDNADRDDVYREVCQRHPDAAVIVPPQSSTVPTATEEGTPTKRAGTCS